MSQETEFQPYREGLDELAEHYKQVLTLLGEDTEREGLLKTPMRVAKAMQGLTRGYQMDAHKVLTDALFKEDCAYRVASYVPGSVSATSPDGHTMRAAMVHPTLRDCSSPTRRGKQGRR